jgi:hypothetical protein
MLGVVAIAVPALAAGMTGEPTTCLAIGIPADGIDPCVLSAAEVEAIVGVPVSATVVDSLNPPWQECEYRFEPSGLLAVGTVSDARLRNSVTPTTAAQDYATQLAEAQARGPVQTVDQLGFKGAAEQDDRRGIQAHVLLQADVFNYHGYLIERRSFGGMPFGDLRTCEIIVEEIERKQAEREASEARSRDELNRLLLDINPAISILAGYACHPYRL